MRAIPFYAIVWYRAVSCMFWHWQPTFYQCILMHVSAYVLLNSVAYSNLLVAAVASVLTDEICVPVGQIWLGSMAQYAGSILNWEAKLGGCG